MRAAAGGPGAGASCCRDGKSATAALPGIRRLTAGIDLDGAGHGTGYFEPGCGFRTTSAWSHASGAKTARSFCSPEC
jgi:hypothetical protein